MNFNKKKLKQGHRVNSILNFFFLFRRRRNVALINEVQVYNIVVLDFFLIGDTIMNIPALQVLKRNYTNAKITLICGKAGKDILEGQGLVDKFVIVSCPWVKRDYSFKSLWYFIKSLGEVNSIVKYDMAIDYRGDLRDVFYMYFIRAERKISYGSTGGEYMLTDVIDESSESNEHLIDRKLNLLKAIGCIVQDDDKYPKLRKEYNTEVDVFLREHSLHDKFIVGIHPGASMEIRKWGDEKYAELIKLISKYHTNVCFFIFQGPDEGKSVNCIISNLQGCNIALFVINKSIKQYLQHISVCHLMICNDSGAGHIAAAYSVPSVVIFGHNYPEFCKPFNKALSVFISHDEPCKPCFSTECKQKEAYCITQITLEEVFEGVKKVCPRI